MLLSGIAEPGLEPGRNPAARQSAAALRCSSRLRLSASSIGSATRTSTVKPKSPRAQTPRSRRSHFRWGSTRRSRRAASERIRKESASPLPHPDTHGEHDTGERARLPQAQEEVVRADRAFGRSVELLEWLLAQHDQIDLRRYASSSPLLYLLPRAPSHITSATRPYRSQCIPHTSGVADFESRNGRARTDKDIVGELCSCGRCRRRDRPRHPAWPR